MSEHTHEAPAVVGHAKSALSKKIGPLPAGVWLLAIGGGIAVAVVIRRNANDQATQDAADTLDATGSTGWDQADPGGTNPGAGGSAPGTGAGGDGSYPEGGGEPDNGGTNAPKHGAMWHARHATSNAGWAKWSAEAMASIGFGRGNVSAVLSKYLAGDKLDATERGVLGATLARCGPPPHPPKKKADPGTPHQHTPQTPTTKDHGHDHPGGPPRHGGGHTPPVVGHGHPANPHQPPHQPPHKVPQPPHQLPPKHPAPHPVPPHKKGHR